MLYEPPRHLDFEPPTSVGTNRALSDHIRSQLSLGCYDKKVLRRPTSEDTIYVETYSHQKLKLICKCPTFWLCFSFFTQLSNV